MVCVFVVLYFFSGFFLPCFFEGNDSLAEVFSVWSCERVAAGEDALEKRR